LNQTNYVFESIIDDRMNHVICVEEKIFCKRSYIYYYENMFIGFVTINYFSAYDKYYWVTMLRVMEHILYVKKYFF